MNHPEIRELSAVLLTRAILDRWRVPITAPEVAVVLPFMYSITMSMVSLQHFPVTSRMRVCG